MHVWTEQHGVHAWFTVLGKHFIFVTTFSPFVFIIPFDQWGNCILCVKRLALVPLPAPKSPRMSRGSRRTMGNKKEPWGKTGTRDGGFQMPRFTVYTENSLSKIWGVNEISDLLYGDSSSWRKPSVGGSHWVQGSLLGSYLIVSMQGKNTSEEGILPVRRGACIEYSI